MQLTSNFQLSAKHPDGRIFVVGGETYDQFSENLLALYGPSADRVIEDFTFLLDPSSGQPSQPAAPSVPPYASGGNPQASAPAPGAPTCEHGARTFRTGTGKKGQWTAWFCPQPKGAQQCEAIWG